MTTFPAHRKFKISAHPATAQDEELHVGTERYSYHFVTYLEYAFDMIPLFIIRTLYIN